MHLYQGTEISQLSMLQEELIRDFRALSSNRLLNSERELSDLKMA